MIKIHTLAVLKNEISVYHDLYKERTRTIKNYQSPLNKLQDELYETEEKLKVIKSPGKSDGLGGFVQDSIDKYNMLIDKKDGLKKDIVSYIQANEKQFLKEVKSWDERIESVQYYFSIMDILDKKFIEDFYYNLTKQQCMERYNITNNKSLYRKRDNILRGLLEKQERTRE